MITTNNNNKKANKCIPENVLPGEAPNYICTADGKKYYLSREERKSYLYGGECPQLCPIKNNLGDCPDITSVIDTQNAKKQCESNSSCQFISNAVLNRGGTNYCVPKSQPNCITLTESDLQKSDKYLTDSVNVCDRLNKGCIFNRGVGDPKFTRVGNPKCLKGCLGTKYWKNPKYIWGGGGTNQDPFEGSYDFNDLQLGPKYLEAAPSSKRPGGWGGPEGPPFFGHGKLPRSLGIVYTESHGRYSPPCNLSEGNIGAFTTQLTGENLAGPGCHLTPPLPQFGLLDWSFTCNCPYLRNGGEFRSDAWRPCADYQLDEEKIQNRDVCKGCYIQGNAKKSLYGHCVLGEEQPDTESKLLGCIPDPSKPDKCRVRRIVKPVECPAFCSNDPLKPSAWKESTQCARQLSNKCWEVNPNYFNIISLRQLRQDDQASPFRPGPNLNKPEKKKECSIQNTSDLCQDCNQSPMQTIGIGTKYPNRSYCTIGGSQTYSELNENTAYSDTIARKLLCPPTCRQCLTGYFGEPLKPVYNLIEATNNVSAFDKGPFFIPWVGTQAIKQLQMNKQQFDKHDINANETSSLNLTKIGTVADQLS